MHIITGLVIAGLAGKMKRDAVLNGLPRFRTGPVRVAHAVPGRIRFSVPSLEGADEAALAWVGEYRTLKGVEDVKASKVTGSVIVAYRPEEVDPPLLFGALVRFLGLEEEMDRRPAPVVMRELRELGRGLNLMVYDRTGGVADLWSVFVVALAVMGARRMLQSGWTAFPTGFTLMWWALNSMTRGGEGRM